MTGVILAAGDGVRFSTSTGHDSCKALNKINNKYIIQFALDNLVELGITECVIVVGHFSDIVRKTLSDNYRGIKISYVEQAERKGVINAFVCALESIKNEGYIVLQLADEIFSDFDAENIKSSVSDEQYDFYCGITIEENEVKIKANYSVETQSNNLLKKCIEKPEKVVNNIKGTGFCIFDNDCVLSLKEIYNETENMPCDLCDYLNYLVESGKKGLCLRVAKKEFNINTYEDLNEATRYFSVTRG